MALLLPGSSPSNTQGQRQICVELMSDSIRSSLLTGPANGADPRREVQLRLPKTTSSPNSRVSLEGHKVKSS